MIIVILILFLILFLFPLVVSGTYYKTKKSDILYINQNYVKDARYFGSSFSKMVEEKLPLAKNKKIELSQEEEYYDEKDILKKTGEVEHLVLCNNSLKLNSKLTGFTKEIYCGDDSIFDVPKLTLRALYGKKRLIIGNETNIERWVDSQECLVIYDHCNLGVSASSGDTMCVGYDCTFQRLFAPRMYLGQRPESITESKSDLNAAVYLMSANSERKHNIRYISKDRIDENGVCDYSILSRRNVTLNQGIILKGDIRSHKGVRICKNAVVVGNIFSENRIIIEEGAVILGNILTQSSVTLGKGAVVGMNGQISSIIARNKVTLEGDNIVYGFISCERGGSIAPASEEGRETGEYEFILSKNELKPVSFKSVEEYEAVSKKGFRKNKHISAITIPEGAEFVSKSLCFECDELKKAELATSIKRIGSYAFADCTRLEELTDLSLVKLEEIGTSAFENDIGLEKLHLPKTLKKLGGACFAGCRGLREIIFEEDSQVTELGDHCFRDCELLSEITLPDSVISVGISAFSGCVNLGRISIVKELEEQPGIRELKEANPKIDIELR